MTKVIHIKDAPDGWYNNPDYVYIGRPGHGLKGRWGNPFVVKNNERRDGTIAHYKDWLLIYVRAKYPFYLRDMKKELKGKTLVCFCKPLPCHGDVIAEYVDGNNNNM